MKGNELRQAYLQFFESKGHLSLSLQVNWYLLVIVLQQAKNVCVQVTLKT